MYFFSKILKLEDLICSAILYQLQNLDKKKFRVGGKKLG